MPFFSQIGDVTTFNFVTGEEGGGGSAAAAGLAAAVGSAAADGIGGIGN